MEYAELMIETRFPTERENRNMFIRYMHHYILIINTLLMREKKTTKTIKENRGEEKEKKIDHDYHFERKIQIPLIFLL